MMKKLILILLFIIPITMFSQGLFLETETATTSNGDSIATSFYLQQFTLDFESNVLRYTNYMKKELFSGSDTLVGNKVLRYGMTLSDSVLIGGSWYNTVQIFNAIFTAGDIDVIKIVDGALIDMYPLRKYLD